MKSGTVKIQTTEAQSNKYTRGINIFRKNEFIFLHLHSYIKCALLYQHWFGYVCFIRFNFIQVLFLIELDAALL